MSPLLSKRALIVSVAKGHREMLTVAVPRETARILRLQAELREATVGHAHKEQLLGEVISEAVAEMVASNRWNDF